MKDKSLDHWVRFYKEEKQGVRSKKLELMGRVYLLSGIEPDMWFQPVELSCGSETKGLLPFKTGQYPGKEQPFYPLEQVLRELPKTIEENLGGVCTARYKFEYSSTAGGLMSYKYVNRSIGPVDWVWMEETDSDSHISALRLLVRTLEEQKKREGLS